MALAFLEGTSIAAPALSQTNKLWSPGQFSPSDGWKLPCSDCYVQQVEVLVPATGQVVGVPNPTCGEKETINFLQVAQSAVTAYLKPTSSGNLVELTKRFAFQEVRPKVGGTLGSFLDANSPRATTGLCAPLAAVLPSEATVVTVHLGDWDNVVGVGGCPAPPGECANGWARFYIRPELEQGDQPVVATAFINWSHDRDRVARMFVAYRMPAGKTALDVS
jgi:hypothetical protein